MITNGILATSSSDGYDLLVNYDDSLFLFIVNVSKDGITRTADVHATYEPLFGIDLSDMVQIYDLADKLIEDFKTKITLH